jgi:hypothetical protein
MVMSASHFAFQTDRLSLGELREPCGRAKVATGDDVISFSISSHNPI